MCSARPPPPAGRPVALNGAGGPYRADFLLLELLLLWAVVGWWLAVDGDPSGGERTAMPGTVAAAMGCQNAGVRVTMGAQMPTAYLTGLLTGAVADAVTDRRIQWRVLGTTTLLILGARPPSRCPVECAAKPSRMSRRTWAAARAVSAAAGIAERLPH
ncbi:DUF1275 family protein [Streptomyces parvulus]|uniref:DUF1275 family protein n=1 Tax=Streptomyces parvulus TaxID=146923 RepID=UPI0037009F42